MYDRCCNTCEDVRQAYNEKGWGLSNLDDIIQCKREGMSERVKNFDKEGCQVFGYVEVNRVGGNFHIAPGKSFTKHHVHGMHHSNSIISVNNSVKYLII